MKTDIVEVATLSIACAVLALWASMVSLIIFLIYKLVTEWDAVLTWIEQFA